MNYDLYIITDQRISHGKSHLEVAEAALAGGATVIQFRDKEMEDSEAIEVCQKIHQLTKKKGVPFIVNDRVEIVKAVDADGVHLGQEDMSFSSARKILGKEKIIGISVETVEQALKAVEGGADYLGIGSIYPTATKPDAGKALGIARLKEIRESVNIPIVAIGGINENNLEEVLRAGADGVAVISAVVSAPDITEACRKLKNKIESIKKRLGK
ncbi:MAG TPA: thiamine phosphate synthase [Candidatus Atribacteria bacterium]|nr:thiamine phosphate synthase [Candidatus Atribacteria bacterium]